jgi:hypothetical protein
MKALLLLLGLSISPLLLADEADSKLDQSRQLALELQRALGAVLMSAMRNDGPLAAIAVCHEQAPAIAERVSLPTDAQVSRTALRVRNAANQPTPEQRLILEQMLAQLQQDPTTAPESWQTNQDGSHQYMKAIVMQPQCMACHGHSVKPEVLAAIQQRYPHDQATGFKVGDLRGAFVVSWPGKTDPN